MRNQIGLDAIAPGRRKWARKHSQSFVEPPASASTPASGSASVPARLASLPRSAPPGPINPESEAGACAITKVCPPRGKLADLRAHSCGVSPASHQMPALQPAPVLACAPVEADRATPGPDQSANEAAGSMNSCINSPRRTVARKPSVVECVAPPSGTIGADRTALTVKMAPQERAGRRSATFMEAPAPTIAENGAKPRPTTEASPPRGMPSPASRPIGTSNGPGDRKARSAADTVDYPPPVVPIGTLRGSGAWMPLPECAPERGRIRTQTSEWGPHDARQPEPPRLHLRTPPLADYGKQTGKPPPARTRTGGRSNSDKVASSFDHSAAQCRTTDPERAPSVPRIPLPDRLRLRTPMRGQFSADHHGWVAAHPEPPQRFRPLHPGAERAPATQESCR